MHDQVRPSGIVSTLADPDNQAGSRNRLAPPARQNWIYSNRCEHANLLTKWRPI